MTLPDLVGFTAGLLTTAANVPQVLKTYRLKSAESLSYRMTVTLSLGLAIWVIYGLMTRSWPIIVTNTIALALALTLMLMKRHYDR